MGEDLDVRPDLNLIKEKLVEQRRIVQASYFEIIITAFFWILMFSRGLLQVIRYPFLAPIAIAEVLTDPGVIISSFYFFFAMLQFMLFRRAPLTAAIYRGVPFINWIPSAIYSSSKSDSNNAVVDETVTRLVANAADARGQHGTDRIQATIEQLLARSRSTSQTAQLRPNVLFSLAALSQCRDCFSFF